MNFYAVGCQGWGGGEGDAHTADESGDGYGNGIGYGHPDGSGCGDGDTPGHWGCNSHWFFGPGIHFAYGYRHDDMPLLSTIENR